MSESVKLKPLIFRLSYPVSLSLLKMVQDISLEITSAACDYKKPGVGCRVQGVGDGEKTLVLGLKPSKKKMYSNRQGG